MLFLFFRVFFQKRKREEKIEMGQHSQSSLCHPCPTQPSLPEREKSWSHEISPDTSQGARQPRGRESPSLLKGAAEIIWLHDALLVRPTIGCWQGVWASVLADGGAGKGKACGATQTQKHRPGDFYPLLD